MDVEKPQKYLSLKPGRTNILGIFRVLSSHDYTEECRDFIESAEVKEEEMVEHRVVVFASILAQKLLQYSAKPLSLLGSGLEMCFNILCNNTNFNVFFHNLLRGKVVVPSEKSASFVSMIGIMDKRVDLDNNVERGTNKYFASLCAIASKLAYENDHYIQTIVENTWKY
ncbi:triacylglycerol lipase OBL1-like [Salvia miltiorrhiza]|uniref:triacylglycerol lipase OBL1-like n=1 Tax=Salvia miltiorrhiza TaxID=226208 RepID=UPI0025AD409A|nr:triacylglycerol lipase OBL1-like [Salvia miltiorrhiza]